MPVFDIAIFDPDVFDTGVIPPIPPMPAQSFAVGGGGGHSRSVESKELEELDTFRKLKRLMDGGKSLQQAMMVLDEPEAEEVKEELPKKITPKMKNRTMDPTILAWIDVRIRTLQAQVAAIEMNEAIEREDEDAINFMLPHLL